MEMDVKEFMNYLKARPEEYEVQPMTYNGKDGVLVVNRYYGTKTHFTREGIEENVLPALLSATHHGKNTTHITRVTGYFSRIEGWNKGKTGELKDRYKNSGCF